jgi:hypothetical protein
MNKLLITFGSHDNYIDAGKRIIKQAKSTDIFTKLILYTLDDLKNDNNFWSKHHKFITENKRGCGYWIWKPYLIKKNMENMNNGDILLYIDCGCEIDKKEKDYLLQCINKVKTDKIIGTIARTNIFGNKIFGTKIKIEIEKHWNKRDLIEKLNMNNANYLNSPQREGTTILFLVCDETRALINEWYELCCDYHNIDDTPSIIPNYPNFKEHRHDQSIFSLLTKKYNLFSSISLNKKCIKTVRNRTGQSKMYTHDIKYLLIFIVVVIIIYKLFFYLLPN